MKIIIDTNFIITALKEKINLDFTLKDLFGFYELLVPQLVIKELEDLSKNKESKIKDRESAKVALELINKSQIFDSNKKHADSAILQFAKDKDNIIVATLDRNLKSQIKEKNPSVKFLTIRGKKKFEIQSNQ